MRNILSITLCMSLFVACQKQAAHSPKPTETQKQLQAFEHTGKLVAFMNRKFDPNAANMRFESLPDFQYDGIETILQDALTATICHKNPGAGPREKITINPVFTFSVDQGENGKIVPGNEVQDFLNTCIDTILEQAQNLSFEGEGTLMVSMLDVVEMSTTETSITYALEVYYVLQTEAEVASFPYESSPENEPYVIECPLFNPYYDPTSGATLNLFNFQFNNPNCNPNLRWRQRIFQQHNLTTHNPPHPSTYGGMLMPGFVFRLMYSGTRTANVSPNIYPAPYFNFGAFNIWSDLVSNAPYSVTGYSMTFHRDGIAQRSMTSRPINLSNQYWDPTNYVISDWSGTIGSDFVRAQEVLYTWQEWKWVAIPDPNYWVAINFDEGITSLLNP